MQKINYPLECCKNCDDFLVCCVYDEELDIYNFNYLAPDCVE